MIIRVLKSLRNPHSRRTNVFAFASRPLTSFALTFPFTFFWKQSLNKPAIPEIQKPMIPYEEIDSHIKKKQLRKALDIIDAVFDNENEKLLSKYAEYEEMSCADETEKQFYVEQGLAAAKKAISLQKENSSRSFKWYAFLLDEWSRKQGSAVQYHNVNRVETYLKKSHNIATDDTEILTFMGHWYLSYALIPRWKRWLIVKRYGVSLPDASVEKALICFERINELEPNRSKKNLLMIAKCYKILKLYPKAMEYTDKLISHSNVKETDENVYEEALSLRNELECLLQK